METEYKIITAQILTDLETFVNEHLKEGWECQGGLSVAPEDETYNRTFNQAMIRCYGQSD